MRFLFTHTVTYFLGFALVFAIRLLPFRPPNVEPVMATMMPFAKHFGGISAFLFSSLSIVLFDAVTSGWGIWTLITALAYGALGVAAFVYFRRREATRRHFIAFAIWGTLFYDAVTGLTIGPLLWNQSFVVALVGQIPFTLMHLAGNIVFAALVSPFIYKWIVTCPAHRHHIAFCAKGA